MSSLQQIASNISTGPPFDLITQLLENYFGTLTGLSEVEHELLEYPFGFYSESLLNFFEAATGNTTNVSKPASCPPTTSFQLFQTMVCSYFRQYANVSFAND